MTTLNTRSQTGDSETVFEQARTSQFEGVYMKIDPKTGLHAIIALHHTGRGPAIGGCRHVSYVDTASAMRDVMRLAEIMTYKAIISDLPLGGAKSVLIKPAVIKDHAAYMRSFGEFVHQLGGRYITAPDSNTSPFDMDFIAEATPYVLCTTSQSPQSANPAPVTARGVLRALEAAAHVHLAQTNLKGLHVAIQGVGAVGLPLAESLHQLGVKLTVSDTDPEKTQHCKKTFNAKIVGTDQILYTDCDILAPCALGPVFHEKNVALLKTKIIVGAANNQLATPSIAHLLAARNICYVPNFLANAGGLIFASGLYNKRSDAATLQKVDQIYTRTQKILKDAQKTGQTPMQICQQFVTAALQKSPILA